MAVSRRFRLLAVWLLLLLLVGAVVIIEHTNLLGTQTRRDGHGDSEARLLLPVPVAQLTALEVIHGGTRYRFERNATGAWFYHVHGVNPGPEAHHSHDMDPSLAARIEDAVAAFGRTRIERQFVLKAEGQDYGVTTPETLILLYWSHDVHPLVQYAVGDIAPDTLSRYVLAVGSPTVVTIPNYQITHLLALIEAVAGTSDQKQRPHRSP